MSYGLVDFSWVHKAGGRFGEFDGLRIVVYRRGTRPPEGKELNKEYSSPLLQPIDPEGAYYYWFKEEGEVHLFWGPLD